MSNIELLGYIIMVVAIATGINLGIAFMVQRSVHKMWESMIRLFASQAEVRSLYSDAIVREFNRVSDRLDTIDRKIGDDDK